MSHFDDFFKANYLRMRRYCASFGYSEQDVEEVVADVIHKHYDEYRELITNPDVDTTLRHWMNRRALLDLKTRRVQQVKRKTDSVAELEDIALSFDDPQAILEVKQSLPAVHPILIEYEAHKGAGVDPQCHRPPALDTKRAGRKGPNGSADRTRFCRERKKFMEAFQR